MEKRVVRQLVSIVFTLTVIANFVAMALGKPPIWLVSSPLPLLFLMLFTGLYMPLLPVWRVKRPRSVTS